MITIGSLFSGIGGLELGLEWAGLGPVLWQVERDEYCRRVLEQHWPGVERFDDVCTVGAARLRPVELICGGFPCQDISRAGSRAGLEGSRSGLWYEFKRVVQELRPRFIVVENVASAQDWVDPVRKQLEESGYDSLPIPLEAADVGAPHLRARIFLLAYTKHDGRSAVVEENRITHHAKPDPWGVSKADFCGVVDGLPSRLDVARLRALGNAVVPQCAEVVGWVIRELDGVAP